MSQYPVETPVASTDQAVSKGPQPPPQDTPIRYRFSKTIGKEHCPALKIGILWRENRAWPWVKKRRGLYIRA